MAHLWVVAANASTAKIFEVINKKQITFLKDLQNPEARLKEHDLVTDRPGNFNGNNPARGAFVNRTRAKEQEIIQFAKVMVDYLSHAHANNQFSGLIITASPHFLGLLKTTFDKNKPLHSAIKLCLPKDFTHVTAQELLLTLHEEHRQALSNL